MNAIDFVVRTRAGTVERGQVGGEGQAFLIPAGTGNDISLNIKQSDLRGYDRAGNDLLITLADGRVIVLEGYFNGGAEDGNRLFLSSAGQLNEVSFTDSDGGTLFAQYGPTETWDKWSPSDQLIFAGEPTVMSPYDAAYGDEEVSMLGAAALGGTGLLGAAGAGAAVIGGAALLGGGDDDEGGGGGGGLGGDPWIPPTVNEPDSSISVGGGDDPSIIITGTGNPGSVVEVTIGDETVTGVADDDRDWEVVFEGEDFPEDGDHGDAIVIVTDPDGTVTELDGPSVIIDTTPPMIDIDSGTDSVGDFFNGDTHPDGVTITGTAEAGVTLEVTVEGQTDTVIVGEDGTWSFTYDDSVLPGGEYESTVTITATDSFGNSTTTTDIIVIDTVPHPLEIDPVGADNLVNAAEAEAGFAITGTSTPGATVTVSFGDITQDVVTGADGTWSLNVTAVDFPGGEYTGTITATTVDAVGNASATTSEVQIDTIGALSLTNAPLTGDDVINETEYTSGVTLTGTSQPGSTVEVTIEGVTLPATVDASGNWSVTFGAGNLTPGTYSTTATITATDTAGNVDTTTHGFVVDTETALTVQTDNVEGDGIVNAAEHADGVILTGTAEPGATVNVTMGAATRPATVAADGSWTVNFPASDIPQGETSLPVMATAIDAAGNTATATGDVQVDTFVRNFANTSTPGGADGVINAEEAAQGLTLTGTSEPGSTVVIDLGGVTMPASVDANGNWTVSLSPSQLPSGEQTVTLTATATDAAGNTDTLTQSVRVDTDAGILTISPAPVEGDDMVNFVEASDGVVLTGTSNPGQMVTVTMNGVSHNVMTDASGIWRAPFAASEIQQGTYTADITATITDSAGNTLTRTDTLNFDTEVDNFTTSANPVGGDGVVNGQEILSGVTLTGTTEPGATVQVVYGGQTHNAAVDAQGNWSVTLSAAHLAQGEYTATAEINTTDAAGNTAQTTTSFVVDTEVNLLNLSSAPVAGDDIINAEEALQGVTLNGQVEPGSTVVVTLNGIQHVATVTANGGWSVDIPPSSIPSGTGEVPVLVEATDAAGNTRSVTETLAVDTDVPGGISWEGYSRDHTGVTGITIETTTDAVELGHLVFDGNGVPGIEAVQTQSFDNTFSGQTTHLFTQGPVADGSHLVVTETDAAGNTTGTYLVTDDPATSEVTMTDAVAQALSEYQIDTIDLTFAEDSRLTITEAQLTALSATTDTLVIHGGADDGVTITGAQAVGTTTQDGETFNVFSLGEATVLIDDDITNVVI